MIIYSLKIHLTLYALMDSSSGLLQSLGWSIAYIEGSQVIISKENYRFVL